MLRLMLSLIAAALLWGATPSPSAAQALCGERGEILERLESQFSETPQAIGVAQDGGLIEVIVSPAGGWTILVTYPKRATCVVATGHGWESLVRTAGQPT